MNGRNINIVISKERVYDEVRKTSAYIGAKIITENGDSAYRHFAAQIEDAEFLDRLWREAAASVAVALAEFVSANKLTDEALELSLLLPDNHNKALDNSLIDQIVSSIVYSILVKWLVTCGADAKIVAYYEQKAHDTEAAMSALVNRRGNSANANVPENRANSFGCDFKQNMGEAMATRVALTPRLRNFPNDPEQ